MTVTITGLTPEIVTVIVAVLGVKAVFSVYVADKVPLPDMEDVTEHQAASLIAFQVVFEVTSKEVVPAEEVTFLLNGKTLIEGLEAAWTTKTVIGVRPETVTVILAVRVKMVGFSG